MRILIVIVALVLAGCFQKLPSMHTYELIPSPSMQHCKHYVAYYWLGVEVQERIRYKQIMYKLNNYEVKYFALNEWVENFASMLDGVFGQNALHACVMLDQKDNSLPQIKLEVRQFFFDTTREEAVFEARLLKRDKQGLKNFVSFKRVLAKKGSFEDIVVAMNMAMNAGINELLAKIDREPK